MSHSSTELNKPLPAAVAVGSGHWWLSYRQFPVFSTAWVWRRAALFGLVIVLIGALSALLHYAEGSDGWSTLELFAYFIAGFLVMFNAGPVLAAIVRHRHFAPVAERRLVIAAIVVGLVLAMLGDHWSSTAIMRLTDREFERSMEGSALVINILVLLGLYTLMGGGLALRAYLGEHRRLATFESEQAMRRLQSDKLAADRQLAMLQAQVEPHFLFNSLATIRSDIRKEPEQAERTLDALCQYLRATIPRLRPDDAGSASTLGDQLEICRQYLTVMQSRMGDRLEFSIDSDPGLSKLTFPPFILLSLVENAIRHGLEPSPHGGQIAIRAHRDGQRLIVTVADTGVGLSDNAGGGVGLSNIRHQLRLLHGDDARLKLSGHARGGVEASIELPAEAVTREPDS
ncbi:histidine kinase [Wenzhouxiangella sp. AB-CW3]|uniref:sensor histidine kinase n=1 Tax=Wenzhouxiangella sp. AB-CW3 TaxID=2771012 RepID=UPI00168A639D|nr:histidine kinase [Wenzhouxiangella sp. AB-CW3]QOC22762.1 histidine kinase [Wenzhouxiangella sp. AB-CW3]